MCPLAPDAVIGGEAASLVSRSHCALRLVVTYGHEIPFIIVIRNGQENPERVEVYCLTLLSSLSLPLLIKMSPEPFYTFWQRRPQRLLTLKAFPSDS